MATPEFKGPTRPTHILFHGAGAVGCFYASRLHHPEHNVFVSLTARSNFQAIADNGIHMETRDFGDYLFKPYAVFKGVAPAIPSSLTSPINTSSTSEAPTAAPDRTLSSGNKVPSQWDVIVVTTKSLPDQTPSDAESIAPLVTPGHTAILLIQNGVGIEAPVRERFRTNPILTGVTVFSGAQTSPGTIRQNRWTRLHVGPYGLNPHDGGGDGGAGWNKEEMELDEDIKKRGVQMARNLATWWGSDPDVPVHDRIKMSKNKKHDDGEEKLENEYPWGGINDIDPLSAADIQCVRWHKLAINASFNPSAVLCGGKGNAEMIQDQELRMHVKGVMEEVLAAAPVVLGLQQEEEDEECGGDGDQAPDVEEKENKKQKKKMATKLPQRLGLADPERILRSTERNAGAKPSMLLDWEAGRKMETEVILGNAVRMAREKGVEMAKCQAMYALLKSLEAMREGQKGKGRL